VKIVVTGTIDRALPGEPTGFVPVVRLWLESALYLLMAIEVEKMVAGRY
jgi:hypothetical protein